MHSRCVLTENSTVHYADKLSSRAGNELHFLSRSPGTGYLIMSPRFDESIRLLLADWSIGMNWEGAGEVVGNRSHLTSPALTIDR